MKYSKLFLFLSIVTFLLLLLTTIVFIFVRKYEFLPQLFSTYKWISISFFLSAAISIAPKMAQEVKMEFEERKIARRTYGEIKSKTDSLPLEMIN